MKTSLVVVLLAAITSAKSLKPSCSSRCIEKIIFANGCAREDFQCHCAKPGLIKQLQPCLQSACTDGAELAQAKAVFTTECKDAGIKVNFASESADHLEMVRRADASSTDGMSSVPAKATHTAGARATGTAKGVKPATYTGAAVPREIAGRVFGFVAAVAAAAAI